MTEDRNIIEEQQNIERKQDDIPKGSERIFEGGPTRDMIENWKRQYGDIYMTKFDSETFIWRTLTMRIQAVYYTNWLTVSYIGMLIIIEVKKYCE